jgi:putative FmdB family regulatory protein
MPVYDYYCRACDRTFEVLLSLKEHEQAHETHQVQCPQCHSTQVQQAVTHFTTVTSKKS